MFSKPIKKTDKELFTLIEEKISNKDYLFLKHSKQRMKERNILELDVLYLLSGKKGYGRKRNKRKDSYETNPLSDLNHDWKYCIEGCDMDGEALRIILTFTENLMLVITTIRI